MITVFPKKMRDNKRGAKKGRERVLVENEDDIIARNMMVMINGYSNYYRKGMRRKREEMRNLKRNLKKNLVLPVLLMLTSQTKSL